MSGMNINEIRETILHVLNNNDYLSKRGKKKTTLCIEGPSGIGKTSIIEQIAAEHSLHFVKKNLGEIEETSELVGFPIREFEMENNSWVNEKGIEFVKDIKLTGRTRTSYCKPSWVPQEATENGGILLLDDFSRADPRLIQATMELVDRGTYGGWSLPQNWTVLLSTNPDNSEYFVSSMDAAQKTRFIRLEAKFDLQTWAKWAEREEIDSRCINFLLLNPEMIKDNPDNPVNVRLSTDFFNSISSLPTFKDHYSLINRLGKGSVGSEFTATFISFIEGNLDKIPSPSDILDEQDGKKAIASIKQACGSKDTESYNQAIASLIASRLINNIEKRVNEKTITDNVINRTVEILRADIFTKDIAYHLFKTCNHITNSSIYTSHIDLIKKFA